MFRTTTCPSSGELTLSMRHRYCCLLAASKQAAVSVWQMPVAACRVLNSWWWTERPCETCRVLGEERETNKMQLIWCLLWNFYLNMFRESLLPSSGEQEFILPHTVFCTGSDGCGCVELGRELCALWKLLLELPHMVLCTGCNDCGCVELGRNLCALCALWRCNLHSAHSLRPISTQPQPSQPVQNTICGSAHSCSPDDGHNDARNMLR